MAVNFVDLEVLPSVSPLTSALLSPAVATPPGPPAGAAAEPTPPTAPIDHSASYWVRRRREQARIARALIHETTA